MANCVFKKSKTDLFSNRVGNLFKISRVFHFLNKSLQFLSQKLAVVSCQFVNCQCLIFVDRFFTPHKTQFSKQAYHPPKPITHYPSLILPSNPSVFYSNRRPLQESGLKRYSKNGSTVILMKHPCFRFKKHSNSRHSECFLQELKKMPACHPIFLTVAGRYRGVTGA